MSFVNAIFCIFTLISLVSCGFDYKAETIPAAIGGGVSLELAGNLTSVDVGEGSSLVIVPTLTGILNSDTPVSVTVTSPRNDVGTYFSDTFPISATIPAGSSSTTINLSTVHDVTYTGDLPFTVVVSSPALSSSVVLNLNLKDNEPLVLGSFTVTGVGDSAETDDTTIDGVLLDSQTPKVVWNSSTHASSYDVTILEDDGTTVKCALTNTTDTHLSFTPGTCSLNYGTFYRAKVVAKNGTVSENAPLLRFEVKSSAVLTSDSILIGSSGATITFDPRTNDLNPTATITSVTTPSRGSASFTGSSVTYTVGSTTPGVVTFNYTTLDAGGNSRNGTVTVNIMAPYSWTGAVSNSFHTPGNWCGTVISAGVGGVCNGHTTPPTTTSDIYIDLSCSTSNCSPQISSDQSVRSINLTGNSLTMIGGARLTVGTGGFTQTGGTFTGASGEVYVQDGHLKLTAGTFTAPTSLRFRRWDFEVANGFNFQHNNGTLYVEGNWDRPVGLKTGDAVFNNVVLNPNSTTFLSTVTGTMIINGDLTLNHNETGSTYNEINTGTIKVRGNVTSNNNGLRGTAVIELVGNPTGQTVSGLGVNGSYVPGLKISAGTNPVTLSGNVKVAKGLYQMVSSGTFISTSSTLTIGDAACGLETYIFGNVRYNNLALGEGCKDIDFQNSTVKVDGDFYIKNTEYVAEARNGLIEVKGDVVVDGAAFGIKNSENFNLKLVGNTSGQTVTSTRTQKLPGMIIDTGIYDVTMSGEIAILDLFQINTVGTFVKPAELILDAGCYLYGSDGFQAKLSNHTFPYLKLTGECPYFDFLSSNATVEDLYIEGEGKGRLMTGTLNVTGDMTLSHEAGYEGTTTIALKGNPSGQTVSIQRNESWIPRFVIDTGSHPVTLAGTASLTVANRYQYISSGAFSFGSHPLTLGVDDCVGDVEATMGSLVYNNVYVNTFCRDTYFTDSVNVGGNLTFSGEIGSLEVHMPNPGAGYHLTVSGTFNRNGVTLNAYGASVPP